jgi:hypothetical protein
MPINDRLVCQPSLDAVLGKQCQLSQHSLLKMIFKRRDDTGVEPYAPAPQQCAVGRILHQCVFVYSASGGVPRWKINSALTSCAKASSSCGLDIVATVLMSS